MVTLCELQEGFRRALLSGDDAAIAPLVAGNSTQARERIAIYRNNVFVSLTRALEDTFPVVCRLVDERFFAYAAYRFISAHPPTRACLAEYGAEFPGFLADFEPSRELTYLPDVARLEWLMSMAAHAADAAPLPPSALAGIAPAETPQLVLRLHGSAHLISSPWRIDSIWLANRAGSNAEIDLLRGPVYLEVSRPGSEVVLRTLDAAAYAFRQTLRQGLPLELATDAALATNEGFDLAAGLRDLFLDQLVVGLEVSRR
jgi:hypothetical protein